MIKETPKQKQNLTPSTEESPRMDRREFFAAAGRMIVPTIGIIGLSLSGATKTVQAANCDGLCSGTCYGACTGCTGSCTSTCQWTCVDTCKNTCSGMVNKN